MNKEETQAIEYLKTRLSLLHRNYQFATEQAIERLLNLIEKQQTEIEDLKKSVDYTYEAYQDAGKKMFDYAEEVEKKDLIINKMAEQLTTPIHSKEWIIDYYKREIEKV